VPQPQRGSFVTSRVGVRQSFAQQECVGERKSAHLARGHLGGLNVAAMDGALEAPVCRALACHDNCRWGNGLPSL